MEGKGLKHVIALLLEDAKRLQELEPNAGTEARIGIAKVFLSGEVCAYCSITKEATVTLPSNLALALMAEEDLIKRRFIRMSVAKLFATEKERAL